MPDNKNSGLIFGDRYMNKNDDDQQIQNKGQPTLRKLTLFEGLSQCIEKSLHQIYRETLEASLFNQSSLLGWVIAALKSMQIFSLAMLPNVSLWSTRSCEDLFEIRVRFRVLNVWLSAYSISDFKLFS